MIPSTNDNYRQAVEWSKGYISERRIVGSHDIATPKGHQNETSKFVGELLAGLPSFLDPSYKAGQVTNSSISDEAVLSLLKNASVKPMFFDAIRFGIANQLDTDGELHPLLREWLINYLRGNIVPPKGAAGRLEESGLHRIISDAIEILVDEGWTATRNDESLSQTSACDVLADALKEMSLAPITFAGVKKVWQVWLKTRIVI